MSFAGFSEHGAIAVITIKNPPVNALSQGRGVVEDIMGGIRRAVATPAVKAVVLAGAGRCFSAGADIEEFEKVQESSKPSLRDLVSYMDTVEKPLVCAVHGATMGGGLETALSCHYRVAAPDALLGFPEVTLGLLPGAGGTQRLPRLIGATAAIKMIVGGKPIGPDEALAIGLIDQIVSGDLLSGAIAFAEEIVSKERPLRRTSGRSVDIGGADPGVLFEKMREEASVGSRGNPAPVLCVECVEASATLPFEKGQLVEHKLFDDLLSTDESRSLRHIFFAERTASKIPDVPADTPIIPIKTAAVVGAGTRGHRIAMCFANAGIPVKMVDATWDDLNRGLASITGHYARLVAEGGLAQDVMDQRMMLIHPTVVYDDLKDADIAVESVPEDMLSKTQAFRTLDGKCKPGAVLATSTSMFDINEIASVTSRPNAVIGLNFCNQTQWMRLLEICRGARSSKSTVATSIKLSKTLRMVGVLVGSCDCLVGNRMWNRCLAEAEFLLDEGATRHQIDQVLEGHGFAMGPFAMRDLIGLDAGWRSRKRPSRLPFDDLTYAGFHLKRREISAQEILERTIYALVNEGAKILEEGIALRSGDIDLVNVFGYGFPAHRGGPMFFAKTTGYDKVYKKIQEFHGAYGDRWNPAASLRLLSEQSS